jgi:protein-tyrosine phosphatase
VFIIRPWYWPKGGQPFRTEPFTWIVKNKLAAGWWPESREFEIYEREGIKVIVNCSEFNNRKDVPKKYTYYHINVPDFGVPSDIQIEKFLEITDKHKQKKEPILVHCVAGCGRTGQFIVAWASKNGYIPNNMDPVKWIRKIRPCSLETREQKNLARRIANKYRK